VYLRQLPEWHIEACPCAICESRDRCFFMVWLRLVKCLRAQA
jgi:hypothetical protein